jgi:tetratricopeptide (TPR) repeat protein
VTDSGEDLLQLAGSRPREALALARTVLDGRPDPRQASIAHQAAGIVLRDTGDVDAGVRELRAAASIARRSGLTDREADAQCSLGVALIFTGRTAQGLAAFDRAIRQASDLLLGRVLYRRAIALWTLDRYAAALADVRRAVDLLERADDLVWTARAVNARGVLHMNVGNPARADADFVAAGRLYEHTSQELESIYTVSNRGQAAFRLGDLPAALSFFDQAAARRRQLEVPGPELSRARCAVLRAAGLTTDALHEADEAVREIVRTNGQSTKRADLLLTAADCALAAGQPTVAIDRAQAACRLFRLQQRAEFLAQAQLMLAQARYAVGPASGRLLSAADRAASRLDDSKSREAARAHLLAGRIALDLGRAGAAERHLTAAAAGRRRGPAIARASGWLSAALLAEAAGQPRRMLASCRRGLDVLDEYRWTLGASELRAQATAHGRELAALALRHAAHANRPRSFLSWAERWRATAMTVPAVRPSADPELNADLAALRAVTTRIDEARAEGKPTAGFERDQVRLEGAVRARSLRTRGGPDSGRSGVDISELLDRLGRVQLVEIVDIDGELHVLACQAGRVRQLRAGRTEDAIRAAEFGGFALRRLARRRAGVDPQSALAVLDVAGPRLQEALLGPAGDILDDGPVVIVPPARLHAIPWALLPALASRAFSVAPSAAAWLRANMSPPPGQRKVTLACGPGLTTGGAEVPELARLYPDATVLSGPQATAERVLDALDGVWLAHVAAHGRFRADSPLFSSLRMHNGPLTVYDFEQLDRAPYRLILSSCDSAMLAPAGADELLGLVASLLPLGTAGLVAGVVQLNDSAVVPLMVALHERLRAGQSLAEALLGARDRFDCDPAERAAALSLLALGAG